MKKTINLLAVVSILSLMASGSFAQYGMMWQGRGGWGMYDPYCSMYNTRTIETISGEVVSVDKFTPMQGMIHGVRMMVKTDKGTFPVHLGPAWYIENQDFKIGPKNKIEVRGSRTAFGGETTIISTQVKKGGKVLTLWDESGCCRWQ